MLNIHSPRHALAQKHQPEKCTRDNSGYLVHISGDPMTSDLPRPRLSRRYRCDSDTEWEHSRKHSPFGFRLIQTKRRGRGMNLPGGISPLTLETINLLAYHMFMTCRHKGAFVHMVHVYVSCSL